MGCSDRPDGPHALGSKSRPPSEHPAEVATSAQACKVEALRFRPHHQVGSALTTLTGQPTQRQASRSSATAQGPGRTPPPVS